MRTYPNPPPLPPPQFLLAQLLYDVLKRSGTAADPARVVVLSSIMHEYSAGIPVRRAAIALHSPVLRNIRRRPRLLFPFPPPPPQFASDLLRPRPSGKGYGVYAAYGYAKVGLWVGGEVHGDVPTGFDALPESFHCVILPWRLSPPRSWPT